MFLNKIANLKIRSNKDIKSIKSAFLKISGEKSINIAHKFSKLLFTFLFIEPPLLHIIKSSDYVFISVGFKKTIPYKIYIKQIENIVN